MEKISTIIPASPRVKTVDLTNGPALRPGTPSFGSPMGTSTPTDKVTISGLAPEMAGVMPETWKNKEERMAKIAEGVNSGFFRTTKPNLEGAPDFSAEMGPAIVASNEGRPQTLTEVHQAFDARQAQGGGISVRV